MDSKTTLREAIFKRYKSISRSPALGSFTSRLRIQTNRIGKANKFFSGRNPDELAPRKIQHHLINSSPSYHRLPPNTLEQQTHRVFLESQGKVASTYFLLGINNAYVMSYRGWVLTEDRDVLIESLYRPDINDSKGIGDIVIWPKPKPIHEKLISANKPWIVKNYYHWMLEFLPKLSVFLDPPDETLSQALKDAKILLPFAPDGWMSQSLAMLGINQEQLFIAPREHLKVDKLFFVSEYGNLFNLPPSAIKWIRGRFSAFMKKPSLEYKRIYITRKKAATRHVQNEEHILQLLHTYGFQEMVLEEMSLAEQINLFSQAEIVVGPHGAGFANIVFSTGATLIDIVEPNHVNSCFYNLCNDSGQFYWYLMAETVDGVNMKVDVDKLERTLEAALHERAGKRSELLDHSLQIWQEK